MTFATQPALAPAPRNLVEIDLAPRAASLRAEVLGGLSDQPKSLPPKLFYDAHGAWLFTRICATQAYYPTRTETGILLRHAAEIADAVGPAATLVEPGAGDMRKIRLLLPALRPLGYVPVDISIEQLREEARQLAREFPWLAITAIAADFQAPALQRLIAAQRGRRVLFFPGSTIGNFDRDGARAFLESARRLLGEGAAFLVGIDLVKPVDALTAAYDDAQGVTAAFNLNLLTRINRELGADFDLSAFRHRAVWNPLESRIEMHLESLKDQSVHVAGRRFHFRVGETLHTENSHKFTPEAFARLAADAGWTLEETWISGEPTFAIVLLRA